MLKELAGDEDPAAWSKAITQWLKQQKSLDPVPVAKLQRSIRKLTIVELWLGLLLGGFPLQQQDDVEDNFYRDLTECEIWVIPALED
jgi:hypothetical protein